jgi:DNA invertase Pin-like site-specific DNA recombinase
MQKALIYCRVSTEEQAQEGYSLDAQEKFCRQFAQNNGYDICSVYRDEGKSGTKLDRPALQDLLARIQQDKSINAVLVQETDRLARNTKDHLTIKAILQKADTKLISVAQPMLDDSPEGNMIDTILASVNQFQSDLNSRKTKKGLQEKFDSGWWPGWAPLGYVNVASGNSQNGEGERKIVKKDEQRWHFIKEGFKMYLTGRYSVEYINDELYQKGLRSKTGKKLSHSIMTSTLKNPFYAGIMKWKDLEKKGNHPPMISTSQYKRVIQIMNSHNQYACRRRKHNFLLRGFVFCNICGQRYTAEKHRPAKQSDYYHCSAISKKHSNQGQNITVVDLENQVIEQFKNIQFSDEFIKLVLKRLKDLYFQQHEAISQKIQVLYNRKRAVEVKRDKAEEKLLAGVLSDDDFARLRTKFKAELDGIQSQIDGLSSQKEYDVDVIQEVVKLTRNIYKTYQTAPYELKRQYLGLFWERFLVQDKRIVKAVPTKLIQTLLQERHIFTPVLRGVNNVILTPDLLRGEDSDL